MQRQGSLLCLTGQTAMIQPSNEVIDECCYFTKFQQSPPFIYCKEQTPSSSQQVESASLCNIRQNPRATNLSAESIRIIQESRHPSTIKRYNNCIGKQKVFCRERGIDLISISLEQPIEFLTKIFDSTVGYSSVSIARSTLSSPMDNGISFGKHFVVQLFIEGIFNVCLTFPRHFAVWDPDIVLDYLSNLEYELPLKDLSQKVSFFYCIFYL